MLRPNLLPRVDESDRLIRRTDVANESFSHTGRVLRVLLLQVTNIMNKWTQALENCNGEEADKENEDNLDKDIRIDDEDFALDLRKSLNTKGRVQKFVTRSEVTAVITEEIGKSTYHCNPVLLAELFNDKPIQI